MGKFVGGMLTGVLVGFVAAMLIAPSSTPNRFFFAVVASATPTATATLVPTTTAVPTATAEPAYTLSGQFVIINVADWTKYGDSPDECSGRWAGGGRLKDLDAGTQVTIKDQAGSVLGVTQFGKGHFERHGGMSKGGSCTFSFTAKDLPKRAFYEVSVQGRGSTTYSFEDLQTRQWRIGLQIGP